MPRTTTEIRLTPTRLAFSANASATREAANGVDFFVPLKPTAPAEECAKTSPRSFEREIRVLFQVARIWATPKTAPTLGGEFWATTFRTAVSTSSRSLISSSVFCVTIRFLPILFLLYLALARTNGFSYVAADGPRISFCALTPYWQVSLVA